MSVGRSAVDLERTLHERFALERFRPGQREVIEQVLLGRDVLCVMPTGGGKSLCYQLPALLMTGPTLVVSPLIALMKDQVDGLNQRGVRATLINSTLDPAEQRARMVEIEQGRYELVYVAPERFRSTRFVEAMAKARIALLAIDEAHCISEWGHDFRPDYARLGLARRKLGQPPCIALTATATDLVRRDIADQLGLRDPAQFVTGFDRPNLLYSVRSASKDGDKLAALAELLDKNPGPAIVYTSSRARCETVAHHLTKALRLSAVIYHAGLGRDERTSAQERFMTGQVDAVVATNAFGMGVDKANIRSVVHFNMPGTIEAYYQEAGRAGRDGESAHCLLLCAPGDRFLQELFIENEYPPRDAVYKVYEFLRIQNADPIELTHAEIRERARVDIPEQAVGTALKILENSAALERFHPRENMAIVRINIGPDDPRLTDRLGPQAHVQRTVMSAIEGLVNRRFGESIYFHPNELAAALGLDRTALSRALRNLTDELPVDYIPPFRGNAIRVIDRARRPRDLVIDFKSLENRKKQEYEKLELMIQYVRTSKCRRSYILGYFGEARPDRCGRCDNCGVDAETPALEIESDASREVLLKILSGVARTKGKFGKTTVAQMLTGSGSEKLARWGLTSLSTFGILSGSGFTQLEVIAIIDALAAAGLIASLDVDRLRPAIRLTDEGWAVVRGKWPPGLSLTLPDTVAAKLRRGTFTRLPEHSTCAPAVLDPRVSATDDSEQATVTAPEGDDNPLRERLKAMRSEWARQAKQPAYCVFSNETLDLLVRERPQSPPALSAIKGLGPARLERYGADLLQAIAQSPSTAGTLPVATATIPAAPAKIVSEPSTRVSAPVAAPVSIDGSTVPTEEWTGRLLDRGFTAAEAVAIRGLPLSAIIRHATWLTRRGRPIPLKAFLAPDTITRWKAWRSANGDTHPPPDAVASEGCWILFLECAYDKIV